jgi:hypothetical protein
MPKRKKIRRQTEAPKINTETLSLPEETANLEKVDRVQVEDTVHIPEVAFQDPRGGSFVRVRNTTRRQRLNVVIFSRTVALAPGQISEPLDEKLLRQPHPARLLHLGNLEILE